MRDRAEALLDDALAAPDELAAVLRAQATAIAGLPAGWRSRPRWRLTGMGSSWFAALDAAARRRSSGADAAAEIASASRASPPGDDVLMLAVSSSGRTAEVLAAATRHRGSSLILALTGDVEAPLASAADGVVPLAASRREVSGVASLSFRATVAALIALEDAAAGRPPGAGLQAAVPLLEGVARERAAWLPDAAGALDRGRPVHVLGDGTRIGTAEQAALMLREGPRIEALAYDTGDWLHTGLYTLFPGDPVLLLTGSPADHEAVETVHARGGTVVAVGSDADQTDVRVPLPDGALADPRLRLLVEPLVAELLAAELWSRAAAR